mmetsp:Transcript_8093/g.6038  ORF Transcript_8093/g.6038 Transcript_8093/m.6038 type:complete len:90 (+) Transcript_8093:380-649(+)
MTATVRFGFAFCRDKIFPASVYFSKVTDEDKKPLRAVFGLLILQCMLLLTILMNQTFFDIMLSITALGFQIAYIVPVFLKIFVQGNNFR